jgi:hypothetical protein
MQDPVRATPRDVDMEELYIKDVGHKSCPLHLALERVVVTPSGTVLACWQVGAAARQWGGNKDVLFALVGFACRGKDLMWGCLPRLFLPGTGRTARHYSTHCFCLPADREWH